MGYKTIYLSETRKYELSTQETILRRTVLKKNGKQEMLYTKVEGSDIIQNVENKSVRWETYVRRKYDYIVMEQRIADGRFTGYIKVVKKSRASRSLGKDIKADAADWMYYKRRKATE